MLKQILMSLSYQIRPDEMIGVYPLQIKEKQQKRHYQFCEMSNVHQAYFRSGKVKIIPDILA